VRFLWAKGLNATGIHTEIFPVYGGKCLSRKAFHKLAEKCGKTFAIDEREVDETTVKHFYAAGFEALVEQWDMCINVGEGYV
jgi:hypothetical protein